jgi:hypothetical protein
MNPPILLKMMVQLNRSGLVEFLFSLVYCLSKAPAEWICRERRWQYLFNMAKDGLGIDTSTARKRMKRGFST